MKKQALISVFYKDGILDFARYLVKEGWELLSTGGTHRHLREAGLPVSEVSDITGFPECLDGRVKTLHPKVHAGILNIRGNSAHQKNLKELGVGHIDIVCVNLYPFFEKVQEDLSFKETVEFIDIGGPTMLRSAAKNHQDVLVLSDAADYPEVMAALEEAGQEVSQIASELKRRLAAKVFNLTSAYDAAVSRFMFGENSSSENSATDWPPYYSIPFALNQSLRYGENSHQAAALYLRPDRKGAFAGMRQIQGKELSYNNIRDLDIAWKAATGYRRFLAALPPEMPTEALSASLKKEKSPVICVALKHNTPCGAALGKTPLEAYQKTYLCDPVSIFGGIVGISETVDGPAAEEMVKTFLEVIVAPGFSSEALEIFASKKNLRLIEASIVPNDERELLTVDGGLLVQSRDQELFSQWRVVSEKAPTAEEAAEMAFGMSMALFVKSNAIVAVKDGVLVGSAGGQVNRIWATEQALERAQAVTAKKENGFDGPATVLVSDAFFPFSDCVEMAHRYGIKAICQPGGSVRDAESIEAADKLGIAMVFTGTRHFKH